jgi:hypothetical protein
MITLEQYFKDPHTGKPKIHLAEHDNAATDLLRKVNTMLIDLCFVFPKDHDTGCCVSGCKGGDGDGGFRMSTSVTGGPRSQHRRGHAVDVFDPGNKLDDKLLTDEILEKYGLYREHPDDTPGWCHLQDLPPGSGRRTFYP